MKTFGCRDVGVDCDWKISADSEEEILKQAQIHARDHHGIQDFPEQMKKDVLLKIRDVQAA